MKSVDLHNFYLDRISKHISGWSNKLLSFTWKIFLPQHVLHNINVYHMMYMATPIDMIKQINRVFKDFLWGFDKVTGKRKMPLVAWHRMMQARELGGLGLKYFLAHSQALLNKWVTKVIDSPLSKWASLFLELSRIFTWDQRRVLNQAHYTNIDRLFFGSVKSYGALTYTTCIWKSWEAL